MSDTYGHLSFILSESHAVRIDITTVKSYKNGPLVDPYLECPKRSTLIGGTTYIGRAGQDLRQRIAEAEALSQDDRNEVCERVD